MAKNIDAGEGQSAKIYAVEPQRRKNISKKVVLGGLTIFAVYANKAKKRAIAPAVQGGGVDSRDLAYYSGRKL